MISAKRSVVLLGFAVAGCGARAHSIDVGDGDSDTDHLVGDADADSDTDTEVDDTDTPVSPCYPAGPYGWRLGDVVQDLSLAGNDPVDGTWSMDDFCRQGLESATVLLLCLESVFPKHQRCGQDLQAWHDEFEGRGLAVLGVSIQQSYEQAREYWEVQLEHTHPWVADPTFTTGQFFDGPQIGIPAYIVIDLDGMRIGTTQQGYGGREEELFEPYLR